MKQNPDLTHYVLAVLAGSPINVECKKAGVFPETLRRKVQKHPDYAKAHAAGKLHKRGLPGVVPMDKAAVFASPAVAEVMAGATVSITAAKHNIPMSTLSKMVHMVHPAVNLHKWGAPTKEKALRAVDMAREALRLAELELKKFA